MKLRKQVLLKILTGLVLLAVAVVVTVVIRDSLASRNPQNAIPDIDVYYKGIEDGARLPAMHIAVGNYTWRFLFKYVSGTIGGDDAWQQLEPGWVGQRSPIDFVFSFPPESYTVSILREDGSFEQIEGELRAPSAKGSYVYRVDANWSGGRTVTYFFYISVPAW